MAPHGCAELLKEPTRWARNATFTSSRIPMDRRRAGKEQAAPVPSPTRRARQSIERATKLGASASRSSFTGRTAESGTAIVTATIRTRRATANTDLQRAARSSDSSGGATPGATIAGRLQFPRAFDSVLATNPSATYRLYSLLLFGGLPMISSAARGRGLGPAMQWKTRRNASRIGECSTAYLTSRACSRGVGSIRARPAVRGTSEGPATRLLPSGKE